MTHFWAALQGAVEYGALTGSQAATAPRTTGAQQITTWAADHQTAVVAALASLLLVGLIAASRRS